VKILLQRVSAASVEVAGTCVGKIGTGLLAFVGVESGDGDAQADWLADKTLGLRIFADEDVGDNGKAMNRSVLDVAGEILVVSQFTLAADTSKGRRPGFSTAASPARAKQLYERYITNLRREATIQTGQFGADMQVALVNDGPVTFLLER